MCDHLIPDSGLVTKFGKWLPSLVTRFRHAVFGSAVEPLGPTQTNSGYPWMFELVRNVSKWRRVGSVPPATGSEISHEKRSALAQLPAVRRSPIRSGANSQLKRSIVFSDCSYVDSIQFNVLRS